MWGGTWRKSEANSRSEEHELHTRLTRAGRVCKTKQSPTLLETLGIYVVDIWYKGCCSYLGRFDRYIANKEEFLYYGIAKCKGIVVQLNKKISREYLQVIVGNGLVKLKWNLSNTKTLAIKEESINEVGYIYTSQGLEFDYVGVIIGDDIRFENYRIVTDFTKRAKIDKSFKWNKEAL